MSATDDSNMVFSWSSFSCNITPCEAPRALSSYSNDSNLGVNCEVSGHWLLMSVHFYTHTCSQGKFSWTRSLITHSSFSALWNMTETYGRHSWLELEERGENIAMVDAREKTNEKNLQKRQDVISILFSILLKYIWGSLSKPMVSLRILSYFIHFYDLK